jgi:uncharacterized protein (TIGR03435 family)
VDETNLEGEYSFSLYWEAGNSQSLVHAAEEQLGLVLTPARRPVQVVVVEPQ